MKVVIALGGNALLRRGERADADVQMANVRIAAKAVAEIAKEHNVVLTHGNGPQVGLLALQADAYKDVTPYPFDVLGAESQGMIGYMVAQCVGNDLPDRQVVNIITQTEVDPNDTAYSDPRKFVGPVYDKETAEKLAAERGWTIAADGKYFRRVVPSPQPKKIVEIDTIRQLVDSGAMVIASGGGGIPVIRNEQGRLEGSEAVIDKDMSASIMAAELDADALLILTDAPSIALDWGTPDQKEIKEVSPEKLQEYSFAKGSMGPKVEAVCRFANTGKGFGAVGRLEDALDILNGKAGTIIRKGADFKLY
ncbi:MAG: carbamate kinase [Alphaproteobacteria bacterium]|nr:carbamate kinase [Alphaproteobacteria bacterium]